MRATAILRSLRNLALLLIWLAVMLTPCAAFTLAVRGEIDWQRSDYDGDRLWLIQEREQRGLGYAARRLARGVFRSVS